MGNKPRIRFKGFTEDWEQRKLKSIANTIVAGGDIDKTKIKEIGTYPVIANALTKEGIVGYYNDDYRIEAPAVTVTGRGDIGVAKARHQNFTPVVRLLSLTTAHDVDFIEHAINNLKIVSESTGVPQLTVPQLSNYKIHITSIIEEQKIGVFISKLDNLITLHQCKLEKLKLTKKALLQKLFPKNGKHIPEIRFKGFTDAWEQRKLSDVADVRDGTHDSPKFYNDGFPLVTSKNLKGGSIDFSDCSFISEQDFNEINKRSKVDPGDILFGMIGTIGNPAIVEHTGFAIKNVALIKEGNIINNRFIYHLLSSKVFENYIARENAGGTQKFIALNQIRNFDFLAPALVEQNKIIELLDCISQNITLHQRKLERLQEVKKGLLQKMFV